MPSLDDLRSEPVSSEVKKKPFIPTIKEEKRIIPTIEQGQSQYGTLKKKENKVEEPKASINKEKEAIPMKRKAVAPRSLSMSSGKTLKKADFSNIPDGENQIPKDMNVKTTKNMESEIFGPGGPFEKMKDRLMDEYKDDYQKRKAEYEKEQEEKVEQYQEEQIKTDNGNAILDNAEYEDLDNEYVAMDDDSYYQNSNTIYSSDSNENYNDISTSEYKNNASLKNSVDLDTSDLVEEYDDNDKEDHYSYQESYQSSNNKDEEINSNTEKLVDNQIVDLDSPKEKEIDHSSNIQNAEEEIHDETKEESNPIKLDENTYVPIDDDRNNDDEISVITDDQRIESLKSLVSKKITPVSRKLNLSGFKVATKGTTSNEFLTGRVGIPVAKWILPGTGIIIQMKEVSGSNLEKIRECIDRNDNRSALEIIYNHIVSPKPKSFEVWLKSTASIDYDQLFMALYIASFLDSNYIPLDCTNEKCNKTYLTENIKISDMLHFTDDKAKKKFYDLYRSDRYQSSGLYASEIIPISDRFAIGFKEPSLYDIYVERQYFDSDFISKYERTINYTPYINKIYVINYDTKELIPIAYKGYKNDIQKTVRSKIERYDSILDTLDADENSLVSAYINKLDDRTDWVTFRIPETTCPFCGAKHPASDDISAASMVFLRSRLATLAIS